MPCIVSVAMDLKADLERKISQNFESTFSTIATKLNRRPVCAAIEDYLSKLYGKRKEEGKNSMSNNEETEKEAEKELYTAKQCDRVALLEPTTRRIVGYGIVEATSETLHGLPLPLNCLRVSIYEVIEGIAKLPHPIPQFELVTVGDAMGTHVAWPNKYVQLKNN